MVDKYIDDYALKTVPLISDEIILDEGSGHYKKTTLGLVPISTATQTALDLKANLISPTFTTPNIGAATVSSLTSNTSIDIRIDADGNGTEYVNFKNGEGSTVVQITESGYIITNGYLQSGGIDVSTDKFVVDGATGNITTKGSFQLPLNAYIYLGDSTTDNSIRISNNGGAVFFESRYNGEWVQIGAFIQPTGE